MVRSEPIADASLLDILARSSPGTAIPATRPMTATTISSSISVKPPWDGHKEHKGPNQLGPPFVSFISFMLIQRDGCPTYCTGTAADGIAAVVGIDAVCWKIVPRVSLAK